MQQVGVFIVNIWKHICLSHLCFTSFVLLFCLPSCFVLSPWRDLRRYAPPPPSPHLRRCHQDLFDQSRLPSIPQVARFSVHNDMVPGAMPAELQDLTMSEEMIISMAFPVCKVFRLAGGAHGYKGHVLSIAQDIERFVGTLPWLPTSDEMPVIIIQPPGGGNWAGRQFRVSLRRVERALNYLMRHSPPYRESARVDMGRVRQAIGTAAT